MILFDVITQREGDISLCQNGQMHSVFQESTDRKIFHKSDVRGLYDLSPLSVQRGRKTDGHGVEGGSVRVDVQKLKQVFQYVPGAYDRSGRNSVQLFNCPAFTDNPDTEIGAADIDAQHFHGRYLPFPVLNS